MSPLPAPATRSPVPMRQDGRRLGARRQLVAARGAAVDDAAAGAARDGQRAGAADHGVVAAERAHPGRAGAAIDRCLRPGQIDGVGARARLHRIDALRFDLGGAAARDQPVVAGAAHDRACLRDTADHRLLAAGDHPGAGELRREGGLDQPGPGAVVDRDGRKRRILFQRGDVGGGERGIGLQHQRRHRRGHRRSGRGAEERIERGGVGPVRCQEHRRRRWLGRRERRAVRRQQEIAAAAVGKRFRRQRAALGRGVGDVHRADGVDVGQHLVPIHRARRLAPGRVVDDAEIALQFVLEHPGTGTPEL